MAKIGYTEFSFGYAFTENLLRSMAAKPAGAPYFPNLIQEASLGFDIQINLPAAPLFFQYKLPELMKKGTAREIATHHLAGIQVRFFRMSLMRKSISKQHQLLIDLELGFPGRVYYATPCMQNAGEFNAAYGLAEVHRRSVLFSPGEIGPLPDDKAHTVAYRDGLASGYVCSEPKKIAAKMFAQVEEATQKSFGEPRFAKLAGMADIVRKQVLEEIPAGLRRAEGAIRERINARRATDVLREMSPDSLNAVDNILVARELARVGLGLDLLIAQPSK